MSRPALDNTTPVKPPKVNKKRKPKAKSIAGCEVLM
jgi:hypothetical protein